MIINPNIDSGKAFEWGRTSRDYARYRDIYPQEFYEKIHKLGLCGKGMEVLDLGTGTAVLPRNLFHYGAHFTATDPSENQIGQARRLAEEAGMEMTFQVGSAENLNLPAHSFDAITAAQCFHYFDHDTAPKHLHTLLKSGHLFAILFMEWLPEEDALAKASEELVLKYNPAWSGAGFTRRPIHIPDSYLEYFAVKDEVAFDANIPFTRESWAGRILACRGTGASLEPDRLAQFDREHRALLEQIAPASFSILHCCYITVLQAK